MRLLPDQVKQGILYPDQEVRDATVFYFSESFSPDPEIMPLAIQVIEERGWQDAFGMYSFMADLVQTQETLRWVIDHLRQRGQPADEEEADITLWLLDVLVHCDPDLLRAHEEEVLDLDAVDEDVREAIEERILLDGFIAEKLWSELDEFCEHNKSEDYLTDEDIDFAHRLVEALGRHPDVFDDRVLSILAEEIEDYTESPLKWMEPCAVRLAGELRLDAAVPLIIKKLHEDDEVLSPDCTRALEQIGTDEIVDALAHDFPKAEWGFRIAAAGIFEHIHSDRSVQQCLSLLGDEENLAVKCRLCESALLDFSDQAIEPARQLILDNDLDPDVVEVRRQLLNASMLMGIEFPEFEPWKEESKHDVEFRKKWYAEHYMGGADEEDNLDDDFDDEPLPPPDTVVREQGKIGRNEPCPCGSGRKYKKCCQKKDNGAALFD
ncbi:MAG: SEC-C metal-binding domain-containing protein [Planctomycetota bacterium]